MDCSISHARTSCVYVYIRIYILSTVVLYFNFISVISICIDYYGYVLYKYDRFIYYKCLIKNLVQNHDFIIDMID